jgi:hypothetical protein
VQILCWNFCGLTNYKAISLIDPRLLNTYQLSRHSGG